MTREEAKWVLELIRDRYSSVDVDRLSLTDAETDAMDMAIEALERQQGRWLLDGRCSECLVAPLTSHKNFCPNCGAKMDEREEEDE